MQSIQSRYAKDVEDPRMGRGSGEVVALLKRTDTNVVSPWVIYRSYDRSDSEPHRRYLTCHIARRKPWMLNSSPSFASGE